MHSSTHRWLFHDSVKVPERIFPPASNDLDYIPIDNSTVLDSPDQLDNAFLNNVLSETSRLLLSNDDILQAADESRHDCSSSSNTVLL